jgi:hypothetical protein
MDNEGRVKIIEALACLSGSREIFRNREREGGKEAVDYLVSEAVAKRRRRSEMYRRRRR